MRNAMSLKNDWPPILIADDDPDDILALTAALESLGHPIIAAASGVDALRLLLTNDICLVVLDLSMVPMGGLETASLIRSRRKWRDLPIVFLSGFDEEAARRMPGWPTGPATYLRKPATAEDLRNRVETMLGYAGAR
jgi:CheY-like chemotaxis protein